MTNIPGSLPAAGLLTRATQRAYRAARCTPTSYAHLLPTCRLALLRTLMPLAGLALGLPAAHRLCWFARCWVQRCARRALCWNALPFLLPGFHCLQGTCLSFILPGTACCHHSAWVLGHAPALPAGIATSAVPQPCWVFCCLSLSLMPPACLY